MILAAAHATEAICPDIGTPPSARLATSAISCANCFIVSASFFNKRKVVIERIIKLTAVRQRILGMYEDGEMVARSLDTLMDLASKFKSVKQFLFMVQKMKEKPKLNKNSVKMMTIHGSKGLEFENVFVVGVNPEILPSYRASDEEERRLFYVAMTRAIDNLYVYGNSNYVWEIKSILEK